MKACDLQSGSIVKLNGAPHAVEELQVQTPSARGGASLYKVRFRNLATKQKADRTFKGEDALDEVDFRKREVQFSYEDQDAFVFMDSEDYSEYILHASDIADEKRYLTEDLEGIYVLISEGKILGVQLPPAVNIPVASCDPSIRGASATARVKPATLATGLVVQVPEYISPEDTVRVDTRTGKFLGRV